MITNQKSRIKNQEPRIKNQAIKQSSNQASSIKNQLTNQTIVGVAAHAAETAKRSRCGPSVFPLVFESGIGAFECSTRFLHWRMELETAVAYQLAGATLLCLGRSAQIYTTLPARCWLRWKFHALMYSSDCFSTAFLK